MEIKTTNYSALNYYYKNLGKINHENEINENKISEHNKYIKKKKKKLFSDFSKIEEENIKNSIKNIIDNESRDTLDYNSLDKTLIDEFEQKRNLILEVIVTKLEKSFNNFNDMYIFRIINIIDRYIYNNFQNLDRQKIVLIVMASFNIFSKFDKININFQNNEITKIEYDIMKTIDFNFNFITTLDIIELIWIINNDGPKNDTFFLAELILIISLYFIELLKFNKITLAVSSLIYAGDITGNRLNKNKIELFFELNSSIINKIKRELERTLKDIINNKKLDYIFRKFENIKYLQVANKYFKLVNAPSSSK